MMADVPRPVVVASVPAEHPYVMSAIARPGQPDDGVLVLPDVVPDGRPAGQWWPPVALDPDVLRGWLDGDPGGTRPDVLHVHFGFEGIPLADLEACIGLLRDHGVPLVVTVHDLRNPHLQDDREHALRLDLLVRAADAVITLTPRAADEIGRRWQRRAIVIPHPHVAPLDGIDAPTPPRTGAVTVGLPLKSLRANTLTAAQVGQVADVVTGAGANLRISIHQEAMSPGFPRHDPAMVAVLESFAGHRGSEPGGRVDVQQRSRLDDDAFLADLASHDAVILPYRFGTHSGILEACRDVHTTAIAPRTGCYSSQAPCPTYDPDDIPGTLPAALDAVVRAARDGQGGAPRPAPPQFDGTIPSWAVDRAGRQAQARLVRQAHREVYASLLDAPSHARGHR